MLCWKFYCERTYSTTRGYALSSDKCHFREFLCFIQQGKPPRFRAGALCRWNSAAAVVAVAAATVVAAVITTAAVVAPAIAAAAEQDDDQDDDPAAATAKTVVITHSQYLL